MEALIYMQLAQKEIMERFVENYKKDGKDRRTQSYYEKRIKDFQEHWNDFNLRHKQILALKYSDDTLAKKKLAYFEQDIYLSMEEFFFSNYSLIEDRFKKEFPPTEPVSAETDLTQTSILQESHGSSIKLPKISLVKFCGDYTTWPTFHDLFNTLVHTNSALSPGQKLQYLKLHLSGEPEHLLRHIQITDANYKTAWNLLKERYNNKRVLVNTHLKILLSQGTISSESAQAVKELLDTTTECLQALTNLEVNTLGWDPMIVYLTVQRLPQETRKLWEQDVSKSRDLIKWSQLKEFLESRFRTLEAISPKQMSIYRDHKNNFKRSKPSTQSFHIASNSACPVCLGGHSIRQCHKFSSLNPLKRMEVVKMKGLCINCLGSGHVIANCPSQHKCYHCKQRHHSLLHRKHIETDNQKNPNGFINSSNHKNSSNHNNIHIDSNSAQVETAQVISATAPPFVPGSKPSTSANLSSFLVSKVHKDQVLLATALVKMVAPSGQEQIVRALIDQGSQASFLTECVVQSLKLKREAVNANIHGVGKSYVSHVNYRVNFKIKPLKGEAEISVSSLVLRKLTNLLPSRIIFDRNWSHIEGLDLADPEFYNPRRIDLLLGADVYSELIMDGLIKGSVGSPIAQQTALGWILSGEIIDSPENSVSVSTFHLCAELDNQLKRFWELEEIQGEKRFTEEEELCEQLFTKTHRRLPDGRYEVELPFKEDTKYNHLGKSKNIALSRLHQMEARFSKNPKLREEYVKCLGEYVTLGHMEKVYTNEDDHKTELDGIPTYSCSYLPHHGVIKESSTTTKCRVVFDASRATASGISLNDKLLKGPLIQDDLASILIRWRKHQVAFTADIEKMYRQVRVKNKHTEYQRIVWRESSDSPIQDYKLLTVTFGTKSAPYLATRILKQLAFDEQERYPIGSKITFTDFYVDDLLSGADTVKSASESQEQLSKLMIAGGFSLRKWMSNNNELLETIPEDHREGNLSLNINGEESIRTLGLYWNPQADLFLYSIQLEEEPPIWTKRIILSEIARLFDPLGWLAPSLILAKILIQKLWLSGLEWDEETPSDLEREWLKYREKIIHISTIHINRWTHFSETDTSIELHGFSDASVKAYAAVVCICTTNSKGDRNVTLVTAKGKVAPIKAVSLPRLELCGAVLVAKLLRFVIKALNITKQISIYAWTDSEIVLAWLGSHPTRWATFVANRVSHIHELLGQCVWAHVASKENPADCASRGIYPEELREHKLWWNGPDWLWQSRLQWPNNKKAFSTNLEHRKVSVHHVSIAVENLEARFSSLSRLLRITAYCKRFINNSRQSPEKREKAKYLKANEIQEALKIWLKTIQHQHFIEEIHRLKGNQSVDRRSRLLKLNPFLDPNEILRVGGRLRYSDLPYNERHPIILPDKCNFTKLLIEKTHKDTLHGGPQLMMNVLTRNYWLINARNTIRHHIHKCIPCYRQKASVQTQLMGDLPTPRVRISRPFTSTGVDYCGPFDLKTHKGRNPKKYKAYIALFVCMATKALHLELVTDLSADGFIAAFRRFCSRRGLCRDIYCDCGTNFVGAHRLLTKQQKQMVDQLNVEMATILENEGINFHFIPPASPHFGGLWESGVRSTKYHLKRVLGNIVLTYEEFTTILTQIEASLNSRPLCELSSDPRDLNPLTPAHFLIGDLMLTPPEPSLLELNINRLDRWQLLPRIHQHFWKRWNAEYLCRLQQRPKWTNKTENVKIGDLVILKDENLPPCRWILGRIMETHPGPDGLVRVVTLKTKNTILKRPITKICLLPISARVDESNTN